MRRVGGYGVITDPDRPLEEFETASCGHCSAHIRVKPLSASTVYLIFDPTVWQWREEPGAFCRVCMRPVCLACHDVGICRPLEHRLARAEKEQRSL